MKKTTKLITLFLIVSHCIVAQSSFQKTYGTSGSEGSYSIHQSNDQGYIISGIAADQSIYALKINANGDTLWSKKYFGGLSSANAITNDGGYVIAGYMTDQVLGCNDFKLIKTDENGTTLWSYLYIGTQDAMNISVIQTADNGYLVAGTTDSTEYSNTQNYDFKIVKVDANGVFEWTKTYGSPGANDDEQIKAIQQTSDLGYILFGEKNGETYLIKTDTLGNTVWANTYGTADYDYGNSIFQTQDGGYIIAGASANGGGADANIYVCKIDASGTISWSKNIGGTGVETANSIRQTADGSYLLVGQTTSFGAGNFDVLMMKLDSDGALLWSKSYGGTGDDRGIGFDLTQDGGAIITGYTSSYGAGGIDIYVIKTDNNGVSNCNEIDVTPQVNAVSSTAISAITPERNWGGLGNDMTFTIPMSNTGFQLNIACESVSVADRNNFVQVLNVYPNPATDKVYIAGMESNSTCHVTLSDVFGKVIKTESFNTIDEQFGSISLKTLPKGIYFMTLKVDTKSAETIKLVKE